MTGERLKEIREALGLGIVKFARSLGYSGNANTLSVRIRRFERDVLPIPDEVAENAERLVRSGS
jgi:transcriptional regulator with XRE-family HTH domain